MRVLILSNIEWSDNNAFGNTLSNLFSGIDDIEIASLYRRSSKPINNVCKKYYRISYTSIIRNFFQKEKIGEYIETLDDNQAPSTSSEKKAIGLIHKLNINKIAYYINDFLFMTKRWENKKFKEFICDYSPDIVFYFTRSCKVQNLFIRTIKKYVPECKFVTFVVDDICAVNNSKKEIQIINEQLTQASKIYAITPSLKEKYEELFDVEIDILTKGCDFSLPVTQKQNPAKTIVYAGNLLYGREKTLIHLGQEINRHNEISENKLLLKIYSPTVVDDSVTNAMKIPGASEFLGPKPYSEIVEIMNSSDIVLHVESFDEEQQKVVKHSFSTKITDCMQSGSVLFSIGPNGLASIEATKNIDGAFCAVNFDEMATTIREIADADLYERAQRIRVYAVENFAIEKIQQKLLEDFKKII